MFVKRFFIFYLGTKEGTDEVVGATRSIDYYGQYM
jgi:hypothetical protein